VDAVQRVAPAGAGGLAPQARLGHRPQRGAGVGLHGDVPAAVVGELVGGAPDAQPARLRGEHRRRAVAELEVEPAPHRDHQLGLAHGARADGGELGRMVAGDHAATLGGVEVARPGRLEERPHRAGVVAGAAAGDHQGAPATAQQLDRGGHRARVGQQRGAARRGRPRIARLHARGRLLEHVGGDLDAGRSLGPLLAERRAPHRVQPGEQVAAVPHRLDPPAEGGDDRRLGDVLERAHAALGARGTAGHHHHR
jgi:hypothetical protein